MIIIVSPRVWPRKLVFWKFYKDWNSGPSEMYFYQLVNMFQLDWYNLHQTVSVYRQLKNNVTTGFDFRQFFNSRNALSNIF